MVTISFQEFLEKWNGEFLEVAGTNAKNQCVDLVNGYIRDVLGNPIIEWTNAKDFPSHCDDLYDWIPNQPDNHPEEGDIVVWGMGDWGHVAICIKATLSTLTTFDENWPTGSPCRVIEHTTYNNVSGWMRPKGKAMDQQALIDELRNQRDTQHREFIIPVSEALGVTHGDAPKALQVIDGYKAQNTDLSRQVNNLEEKLANVKPEVKTVTKEVEMEVEVEKPLSSYSAGQLFDAWLCKILDKWEMFKKDVAKAERKNK